MSTRTNAFAIASIMSDPSAAAPGPGGSGAPGGGEGALVPPPPAYGPQQPAPSPYFELDWSSAGMAPVTNGYSSGLKAMEGNYI